MDLSYAAITGKTPAADPVIAVAPDAASVNTNSDSGAEHRSMRQMADLRSSPAAWYVLLVLATAALAKSLGVVRAA